MAYMKDVNLMQCRIKHRNFEGRQTEFNRAGDRRFSVIIEPANVQQLIDLGWPVKVKGTEEAPEYLIDVKVRFDNYPPRVCLVVNGVDETGAPKQQITQLNADTVKVLDTAEIEFCDICLTPYSWTAQGRTGVSAYLKTLYATIVPDPIAEKYGYNNG